jgi:hypothetical protein
LTGEIIAVKYLYGKSSKTKFTERLLSVVQKYQKIVEELFGLSEALEIFGNAAVSGVTPTAATSLLVVSRRLGNIAENISKDLDGAANGVSSVGESIAVGRMDPRNISSPA